MPDWPGLLLLFVTGFVAGTINVIAGGGSFLTLPVLIFLGLPAGVANGTNRVGILVESVGAVWGFHRYRVLPWTFLLSAAVPSMAGAVFGTWGALLVSDQSFRRILALLMIAVTLWSLFDPFRNAEKGDPSGSVHRYALMFGFFLVGIYGGFVQAGVGFFLLAATTLAGLDLVKGNAVKVLSVLFFTGVSLSIFAWQGKVVWTLGFCLAAGTLLGGQLGVRLTVLKGHRWVRGVVTVAILLFAVRLWLSS